MLQRKPALLTRRVRQFLRQPRTARLATIGPDGYPHIIPIWFMLDGDDLVFGSDRDNRKVRNALANPKGAVVIGGEPETDDAGYMIQGDLAIEEDPRRILLRRMMRRYEAGEEAEDWMQADMIVIRLKPRKVIRVI